MNYWDSGGADALPSAATEAGIYKSALDLAEVLLGL